MYFLSTQVFQPHCLVPKVYFYPSSLFSCVYTYNPWFIRNMCNFFPHKLKVFTPVSQPSCQGNLQVFDWRLRFSSRPVAYVSETGLFHSGSNSKLLVLHSREVNSIKLHVTSCSSTYLFGQIKLCCSQNEPGSTFVLMPFSLLWNTGGCVSWCSTKCWSVMLCSAFRTICSTAVIPWVVPVQSRLSTWLQCLGCFQMTNWKCFLVS